MSEVSRSSTQSDAVPVSVGLWILLFTPSAVLIWAPGNVLSALSITRELSVNLAIVWQTTIGLIWWKASVPTIGRQTASETILWRLLCYLASGRAIGWFVALCLFASLQIIQWALLGSALPTEVDWAVAIRGLAFQVFAIALIEELWFRGLWFTAAAKNGILAVVGGAALFAIYHVHQGPATVMTTFGLGVAYGAARWRGAPLLSLIATHAILNWLNSDILITTTDRMGPTWMPVFAMLGFISMGALVLIMFRPRETGSYEAP